MTKPNKPDKAQMQQMSRFATFQRESVDAEKRTVEVAFSSETAVERWFGLEILLHDKGACDLARLNDAGAALFNHNWNHQIGMIERAWVDTDKKGRAPSLKKKGNCGMKNDLRCKLLLLICTATLSACSAPSLPEKPV